MCPYCGKQYGIIWNGSNRRYNMTAAASVQPVGDQSRAKLSDDQACRVKRKRTRREPAAKG